MVTRLTRGHDILTCSFSDGMIDSDDKMIRLFTN